MHLCLQSQGLTRHSPEEQPLCEKQCVVTSSENGQSKEFPSRSDVTKQNDILAKRSPGSVPVNWLSAIWKSLIFVQFVAMLAGKLPVRALAYTLKVVMSRHASMLLGNVPCMLLATM